MPCIIGGANVECYCERGVDMNVKAGAIAYLLSGAWLIIVTVYLSDYHRFRRFSLGTWGFILVDLITLAPVILALWIADRFQPAKSGNSR